MAKLSITTSFVLLKKLGHKPLGEKMRVRWQLSVAMAAAMLMFVLTGAALRGQQWHKTFGDAQAKLGIAPEEDAGLCCLPEHTRITFETYLQIEVGMTMQNVDRVLGGGPRNESNRPARRPRLEDFEKHVCRTYEWWGPSWVIYVTFDKNKLVKEARIGCHDYGPACGRRPRRLEFVL